MLLQRLLIKFLLFQLVGTRVCSSLNRMYAGAILPDGKDYTFGGKGVSQGHSDAIRRIEGVQDAKTIQPFQCRRLLDVVRSGKQPELTTREKSIPGNVLLLPKKVLI